MLQKPFEDRICISENLTSKHRLLFAKHPHGNYHLLVATKEPQKQNEILDLNDFQAALIALKAVEDRNTGKAFMYFEPYAIMNHKHLNVIPVDSLLGGKIPINVRVLEAMKRA